MKLSGLLILKRNFPKKVFLCQNIIIDIDRILQTIQVQASKDSLDAHSTVDLIKEDKFEDEEPVKLNWESLQDERQHVHDQRVVQSLIEQGGIFIYSNFAVIEIDESNKPKEKVDKTILDLEGNNKQFYSYYKQKFSLDLSKINPFVEKDIGIRINMIPLFQTYYQIFILTNKFRGLFTRSEENKI